MAGPVREDIVRVLRRIAKQYCERESARKGHQYETTCDYAECVVCDARRLLHQMGERVCPNLIGRIGGE